MKNKILSTLMSLSLLTLMTEGVNAVPSWFKDALKDCKNKIPGNLTYRGGDWVCHMESPAHKRLGRGPLCELKNIHDVIVTDSMGIGDGYFRGEFTDETAGLGKCCTFDDNGEILDAKVITTGQEGCTKMMNNNPKAKHSGIWWYVGGIFYKSLDWWYKGK